MLITRNHSLSVSVKMYVESVVETVISHYERHFNKSRNLDEEQAMDEMEILENGPTIFKADPFLRIPWISTGRSKLYQESGISTKKVQHLSLNLVLRVGRRH